MIDEEDYKTLFPIDHQGNKKLYYAQTPAPSRLTHLKNLDIFETTPFARRTKLILTLSQPGHDSDIVEEMIVKGLDIVRINISHDTFDFHAETIEMVNTATRNLAHFFDLDYVCAVAVDIKGREMRTGRNEGDLEIDLIVGETIRLSVNRDLSEKGKKECVFVDCPEIVGMCKPGTKVLVDDGCFQLRVKDIGADCLICVIEIGGVLGSFKSVTLPDILTTLPIVSPKDKPAIKFAINQGADMIFVPRVITGSDVVKARAALGIAGSDIKVVAKVEHKESLKYIREIIQEADGILISRQDLAIEMPLSTMCLMQKTVIHMAHKAGKPVIVAGCIFPSCLLEDVEEWEDCEVNDVANAVLDGADNIMLSGESALGEDPLALLVEVGEFIRQLETISYRPNLPCASFVDCPMLVTPFVGIAQAAVQMAEKFRAVAICVVGAYCKGAFLVARFNPHCPIIAITRCPKTARQSLLYGGIIPVAYTYKMTANWKRDCRRMTSYGLRIAKNLHYLETNDPIIIMRPWKNVKDLPSIIRLVYVDFDKKLPSKPSKDDKSFVQRGQVGFR